MQPLPPLTGSMAPGHLGTWLAAPEITQMLQVPLLAAFLECRLPGGIRQLPLGGPS